jgi:hypothetical protein
MKKTLALIATIAVLAGCTPSKTPAPSPVPSISVKPSQTLSEPSKARPTVVPTTEEAEPTKTPKPDPQPTPTSTGANTPANEFAQRWGKAYTGIPEWRILKTANKVCTMIEQDPDWSETGSAAQVIMDDLVDAGMDSSDSLEFVQDAAETYCLGKV